MRGIHPWLLLKVILFLLLMPGSVIVYVPWYILIRSGSSAIPELSPASFLFILPGILGLAVLLACVREFAVQGRGTPAPMDPPGKLVIRGLYRYTRNPMYLGVLTVLCAEAAFFRSAPLLVYAAVVFVCFHIFVHLYEERHLLKEFGGEYERYCRMVPRWGISFGPKWEDGA